MAESMKDFERELEASFKRIDEGDIISGTVVSVDESGVVLDLKFYAEGFIPVEEFSRVAGFNIKEAVQPVVDKFLNDASAEQKALYELLMKTRENY